MKSESSISIKGIKISSILEMSCIEFKELLAGICLLFLLLVFERITTPKYLFELNLYLVEMNLIEIMDLIRLFTFVPGGFLIILVVAIYWEYPKAKEAALDISRRWIA